MTTLTVVIPAYNEEKGIAEIINRVLSIKEDLKSVSIDQLELLVVNDGSRDRTCEIAAAISEKDPALRVINHSKNRGYGAALKTGFAMAQGELVGFLDADGTYPPEYFPQLCKAALDGGDLVIGSRMMGADSKMPVTRRIGNVFFATLLTLLGSQRVTDSASGMRVFKKCLLEKIFPLPDGLNLTPVMSTRALHENMSVVEIPIPYSERLGRSKLSVIRDGRIFLESMIWTVMFYNPVRIFGSIGLAGILLAVLVSLGLVIARLSGATTLGPWGIAALYGALVSGVVGISVFALGVAFNYLVSLFYKTPIRQGLTPTRQGPAPIRKSLLDLHILPDPIENYFGWGGIGFILLGTVVAIITLILGVQGWQMTRLWLYLLGSAMMLLVGMQLLINWFLIRVLSELSKREEFSRHDMDIRL